MKTIRTLFIITMLSLTSVSVLARTLVDDNSEDSYRGQPQKTFVKEAANGMDMRKTRRFGIGLQAAGTLGLGGAVMDLNFDPHWSFSAGFGGGEGFQAYMFQGKYVLTGDWLMPYFSFGYANWSSLGKGQGAIGKTTPALLHDKLLNSDELATGEYRKNLFFPAFGMQFMQLNGEYAGFSLYAEILALIDLGGFTAAPTGTLGALYYF